MMGDPLEWPKSDDDAAAVDSAARLAPRGKRTRVVCHRCGQTYNAAQGHLGSDYCMIHERLRVHGQNGYEVVNGALRRLAHACAVHIVDDWVGALFNGSAFRQTSADTRMLAPKWFAILTRRTGRMLHTRRRLLIQSINTQQLRQARAYIQATRDVDWVLKCFRSHRNLSPGQLVAPLAVGLLEAWNEYSLGMRYGGEEAERAEAMLMECEAWAAGGAAEYLRQAPLPSRRK